MAKLNPFRFSTKYQDDETDLLYYGYRYYNASTGRWLSRDPIEERGGLNLYAIVRNDPIGLIDLFGLIDVKFEVVRGDRTSDSSILGGSGTWSDPWWCTLKGDYSVSGNLADSTLTIKSRDGDGGSCNTVDKDEPAGTILLYLKDRCGGEFDVTVRALISVSGTGPQGAAQGQFYTIRDRVAKHIFNVIGTTSSPKTEAREAQVRVRLNSRYKLVAKYTPTISFPRDFGKMNTGTAYGLVQYITATRAGK